MSMLPAGKLNRSVRIEEKQITKDPELGEETIAWITHIAQIFVNIEDVLSGSQESTASNLRQLKRPARVRMRYISTITADMRLVALDRPNPRVMHIVSKPSEIGRLEGMEFMVEEYSPDGSV